MVYCRLQYFDILHRALKMFKDTPQEIAGEDSSALPLAGVALLMLKENYEN
jgi:hypothetical protein